LEKANTEDAEYTEDAEENPGSELNEQRRAKSSDAGHRNDGA
jgi:hypothetical protein